MTTFAPDNESRNRLVAQNRVIFKAIYSRILSPERSPNRNPDFSQSSASPLHKEILQFFPKLRKKVVVTKRFWKINAFRPEIKARRGFRAP